MAKKYRYGKSAPCTQAVIFTRVSSKDQEPGASLDAQKEIVENYCLRKGLPVVKTYRVIESSTSGKRKLFNEMMDFVKKQKQKTAIVVHCIDRFQRRFNECVEVENLLLDDKTDLHFCKEDLILTKNSSSADIMRWDMGILSGKMYVANLRDNVNRGMNYNWSIGKFQGKSPIGYLNVNKDIIVDTDQAPIIKKMFEMYATGHHTIGSIHKFAVEMNLRSSHSKSNRPVGRESVYTILKNPFYYGQMKIREELMPHAYEPLISKALYDKVQNLLSGKSTHTKAQEYATYPFVFRKLIKCGHCGRTISADPHNNGANTYLRCVHKKGECPQELLDINVALEQLETEVFSKIRLCSQILEPLKKCVQKKLVEESEANAIMKRKVTIELNNLEDRERRIKDAFYDGDISKEEWQEEKANILAKRSELQKTADKYTDMNKEIQVTVNEVLDIATLGSQIMKLANPIQQNKLLSLILDECYLKDDKLVYKLHKPFDKLVNVKNANNWFDFTHEDVSEYEQLAEKIQSYKTDILH